MYKILLFLFINSMAVVVEGQQDSIPPIYSVYEEALYTARAADDLETAFQYLDSIENLGPAFEWEAAILRVDLYRFIEDSLSSAEKLIDACIAHYQAQAQPNIPLLLHAYGMKFFVTDSSRDIVGVIETTYEAIKVARAAQDSTFISYFEQILGVSYLYNLRDTTNACKHLSKALDIAVQSKNWANASFVTGEFINYYLLLEDTAKALDCAIATVAYSTKLDAFDSNYYDGYIDQGAFFIIVADYPNAIKAGSILYQQGLALQDYDNQLWGAHLLTEAYWKYGNVDSAYHFAQIALDYLEGEGGIQELITQYYWSSKVYAAKGLYQEALELLDTFYELKQNDYEKIEIKAVAKTLYQEALKRKELEKSQIALQLSLTEEISEFKSILILGVCLLFIIITLYSVLLYKRRQKTIALNNNLAASREVVLQQKELLLQNIEELRTDLDQRQEEQESFYFSQSAIQIAFADILYLESSNNYVLIHVLERETPLLERVKMIKLIEGFPSHLFIKTHRSYYVNKKHIVARPSKYTFELSNGAQLNASRSCVENLTGVLGF